VLGASDEVVIAHNLITGSVLWQKEMSGFATTFRIQGDVVVVPVDKSNTVVLDVKTGYQLHTLPSAGEHVRGICVFDGLASDMICFVVFFFFLFSGGVVGSLLYTRRHCCTIFFK
jgi:hypothetical protein